MTKTPLYRVCEWLDYLEQHPEEQSQSRLRDLEGKMCCLGALCYLSTDMFNIESRMQGYRFVDNFDKYSSFVSTLPTRLTKLLGFRSQLGDLIEFYETETQVLSSLASMNDSGVSWEEISKFIQQKPEQVFTNEKLVTGLKEVVGRVGRKNSVGFTIQSLVEAYRTIYVTGETTQL